MNSSIKYVLFVDLSSHTDGNHEKVSYNGQCCFFASVGKHRDKSENEEFNIDWTWIKSHEEWTTVFERERNRTKNERVCDDLLLADHLHHLADKLPHAGYQVQIIWLLHKDDNPPLHSNLLMFGALKRLQCWHNAEIVCILSKHDAVSSIQSWVDYLNIELSTNLQDVLQRKTIWHGQVSLTDRKNLMNCVLPGFSLVELEQRQDVCEEVSTSNDKEEWLIHTSRQISVVQVIKKNDIPLVYITPKCYKLSVMANSCWVDVSRCFLESITEGEENIAMIVTLECQKLSTSMLSPPECLSTIKWKRQISANPMDFKVPDVELKGSWFSVNFLLCKDDVNTCNAFILSSPNDFNGHVMIDLAIMDNLANKHQHFNEVEETVETIAKLNAEKVLKSEDAISKIQLDILQHWSEDQKNQGHKPMITVEKMKWFLNSVRRRYFDHRMEELTTNDSVNIDNLPQIEVVTELELSPLCWVERQALQSKESYIRKMKRFKSSDRSLAGISAPPVDSTITLDAKEFIKHFRSDGLALAEELSPIAFVNGSGRCTSISRPGMQAVEHVTNAPFNEALKYNFYGINYCLDSRNAVYYDDKYQKLESRIIRNETVSTCTIEQVDSPATMAINPTRSSPRKRLVRTPRSKAKLHSRKVQSPRSAKRRASTKLETSSKRHSRWTSPRISKAAKRPSSTRITNVATSEEVIPEMMAATISKRMQPTEKAPQVIKQVQSRSERHKRKLKYIVDQTLQSKGIGRENVCYPGCSQRLYSLTKSFVQDLKSSKGLDQQMRNIAESNVDQVVSFEKCKKSVT